MKFSIQESILIIAPPLILEFQPFSDLPSIIKNKGVLNTKSKDPYYYLWSIVAAFHPCDKYNNPHRVSSYQHFPQKLKYDHIQLPIS